MPEHRHRRTRTDPEGVSVSVVGSGIQQSGRKENPKTYFKRVITLVSARKHTNRLTPFHKQGYSRTEDSDRDAGFGPFPPKTGHFP